MKWPQRKSRLAVAVIVRKQRTDFQCGGFSVPAVVKRPSFPLGELFSVRSMSYNTLQYLTGNYAGKKEEKKTINSYWLIH